MAKAPRRGSAVAGWGVLPPSPSSPLSGGACCASGPHLSPASPGTPPGLVPPLGMGVPGAAARGVPAAPQGMPAAQPATSGAIWPTFCSPEDMATYQRTHVRQDAGAAARAPHVTGFWAKLGVLWRAFLSDRDYRTGLAVAVTWRVGDGLLLGGFLLLLASMNLGLAGLALPVFAMAENLARNLVRLALAGHADDVRDRRGGPGPGPAEDAHGFVPQLRRGIWVEAASGVACIGLGALAIAWGPAALWVVLPGLFVFKMVRCALQEARAAAYGQFKETVGPLPTHASHASFLHAFEITVAMLAENGLAIATCAASLPGLLPLAPCAIGLVAIAGGAALNLLTKVALVRRYAPVLSARAAAAAARSRAELAESLQFVGAPGGSTRARKRVRRGR